MNNVFIKNISRLVLALTILIATYACEQESIEPLLVTEDGAGTLINFKAYEISDMTGLPDSAYGRIVFWQGLDAKTLVQLSMYNVSEGEIFQTEMIESSLVSPGDAIMSMYDVVNTGEGYDFGEFATSKYFVIDDLDFYSGLPDLDAHVVLMNQSGTIIAAGDIGMNAIPIDEN